MHSRTERPGVQRSSGGRPGSSTPGHSLKSLPGRPLDTSSSLPQRDWLASRSRSRIGSRSRCNVVLADLARPSRTEKCWPAAPDFVPEIVSTTEASPGLSRGARLAGRTKVVPIVDRLLGGQRRTENRKRAQHFSIPALPSQGASRRTTFPLRSASPCLAGSPRRATDEVARLESCACRGRHPRRSAHVPAIR